MKAILILLLLATSGCMSHNLPKDALVEGAYSKITTPWGTSELKIDKAATGIASRPLK